jgi:titin
VGSNITTFVNSDLVAGETYSYRVKAFNGSGNSAPTNVVTATTSGGATVPAAPTSLRVTGTTSTSVQLAWTDGSTNENGFSIERLFGTTWTQIGWVADNVTTYSASGLTAGTTSSFRVLAFNGFGNSATTNVVSATCADAAPTAPSNLTAAACSSTQVDLAWLDISNNEAGFRIYRKRQGQGWKLVATVVAGVITFQDVECVPGATYTYRVKAYNAAGSSSYSNDARVTMPK